MNTPPAILMIIISSCVFAFIPASIAKKKGRNFWGYFILSCFITPLFSLIIALSLKSPYREASDPFFTEYHQGAGRQQNCYHGNSYDAPSTVNDAIIGGNTNTAAVVNGGPVCKKCGDPINGSGSFCIKCNSEMFKM